MPVAAQKSGMSATVTLGVVQQVERVTLQSTGGGKGAVVGGALGYASGSGKSKSKKRRNAISRLLPSRLAAPNWPHDLHCLIQVPWPDRMLPMMLCSTAMAFNGWKTWMNGSLP